MALFGRKKQDDDGVVWLPPTQVRHAPRRGRGLAFVLALLIGAAAVFAGVVLFLPKPASPPALQQRVTEAAPSPPSSAPPSQAPVIPPQETPAPAPVPVEPQAVTPAPMDSAPIAEPSAAPPAPEADAAPLQDETAAPTPDTPPAAAAESQLSGAFPAPSSDNSDPESPNFAVYLNEAAPDEAGARALAVEAQRRFSNALAGNRLSYRRVKVGEDYAWRLRISGLTRARAGELCEALSAAGEGCEIGPR